MNRICKRAALLGAVALTVLGAGCAEEREPINRVQANALAKSFFAGGSLKDIADDPEFYMRGTVVDVGYGAAQDGLFTATYAQPVARIKWEITENTLNARLAYERVEGTDGKGNIYDGTTKKTTNDGQIVASYVIESHFDIRRDYNPATGEESNVIVENTSDRPWHEREYMRVDWSKNLATSAYNFDTLSQLGLYGGIEYEALSYYVSDPNDADAPHFDPENSYFDVTTKAFAKPGTIDLSSLGWGIDKFPACMLPGDFAGGTEPYGNCNPVEITLRYSFKKVVDNDYEPVDYDGVRFQGYGIFNMDYRYGYERNYGMVDNQWHRFAARYNIWERSHFYSDPAAMTGELACATKETTELATGSPTANPNRDENNNGTADECEAAGPGSQCDIFKRKCTLPYAQRVPRVIPWYIGGDTSEDLFEATNWAVEEWDLAMKTAIQTARLVECRRTGGADCDARFPMWKGQQDDIDEAVAISRTLNACRRANGWDAQQCNDAAVAAAQELAGRRGDPNTLAIGEIARMPASIVLCHNPVIQGDHPACGDEGLSPRLGDLRYNSVLVIEKPQQPSAWGIMVDADDPVTGEKVAASINIWSHVTDSAVQQLVDLIRYTNGDLTTAEITDGKYIRDWAQASRLASGGQGPTMTRGEVTSRLASATKLTPERYAELIQGASPQFKALLKPMKRELSDVAVRSDIPSPAQAAVQARLRAARGGAGEAELMNPAMLQVAGVPAGLPIDGPLAERASPLALNNPKVQSQLRRMHENALAKRGACILHEAPEASGITGLADVMAEKFPKSADETPGSTLQRQRYEQMFKYLQRRFHYSVIGHEMGHSIGLRHNFVSTTASLFFRPQYWQLRTKNGRVATACDGSPEQDPESCVGPRYYDQVTESERKQLIEMFAHSTVMDYPGDLSQDLVGLGVYDFAAARMFYADVASVYDSPDPAYKAGGAIGGGLLAATDNFGGLAGIQYGLKSGDGTENFHYSQLQNNYKVIDRCYRVTPQQPASWNEALDGKWHPVADGGIVTVDGETLRCRQQPVDYVSYAQLRPPAENEVGGFSRGNPSVDPATGRVRVPYGFATDNWADTGNVSVFRHDSGADPYEQMMFLITTHENRHIFDNYRRNRTTFNVRGAADRSYGRYNEKLLGMAGGIGFYGTIYQDLATNQGLSFDTLWPLLIEGSLKENILAATVAFDHFTRQLTRPQEGGHYQRDPLFNDPVLRSESDTDDYGPGTNFGGFGGTVNSEVLVNIPNGSTGYLRDIGFGGHPLENRFAEDKGEYDTEFTISAGAYYDKIHTAILLSESEDRFVSSSRRDFYDARFRAVGMADVLPEGYRRLLANALTNDRSLLAPRLEADAAGKPVLDVNSTAPDANAKTYPARPLGWMSLWPTEGPKVCFPTDGKNLCTDYLGGDFNPAEVARTIAVDPQIGWEVQKFLIAWTLAYIPANGKTNWLDMMRVYRVVADAEPAFEERIEWQDPASGQLYYARVYGMECLFGTGDTQADCAASGGKWVQKGIAARVLEYANFLTSKGYQLDARFQPVLGDPAFIGGYGVGFNRYGRAMVMHHPDGNPIIVPDPAIKDVPALGPLSPVAPCDQNIDPTCTQLTVIKNHYAYELRNYKSVPDYIIQMGREFGLPWPDTLGVYPD